MDRWIFHLIDHTELQGLIQSQKITAFGIPTMLTDMKDFYPCRELEYRTEDGALSAHFGLLPLAGRPERNEVRIRARTS